MNKTKRNWLSMAIWQLALLAIFDSPYARGIVIIGLIVCLVGFTAGD